MDRPAARPLAGSLWMVTACACFSSLTAIGHHLGQTYSPFEIVFFRNLFMLLVFLPAFAGKTTRSALKTRRPRLHLLRAGISLCALYAFYFSIVSLPIAEATALSFTVPLFMIVISIVLLHERASAQRWIATTVGFAGVVVILRPGVVPISPGAMLALSSAVGFALSMAIIKLLAPTDSSSAIVFYQGLFLVPLSAPAAVLTWRTPDGVSLGWLAAIGILSALAQFSLARSLHHADSTAVAPLDFTRLPFAAALGYLFFAQIPDLWTWVGAGIIALSSVYIAQHEARRGAPARASHAGAGKAPPRAPEPP